MAADRIYSNNRRMGESPEKYVPGGFYPVHLGDVLDGRYQVFRKLGAGSQSTVWLARDKSSPERRLVAVKVFGAETSVTELELDRFLKPTLHQGKQHLELSLDSFLIHGPNGDHFCKVLEPLGDSLYSILDAAFERRGKLNQPEQWRQHVLDGDSWSAQLAKEACWQVLLGLDYLHSQGIAHRDIQPANICLALDYDLSSLSENDIQRVVWPNEDVREAKREDSEEAEKAEDIQGNEDQDPNALNETSLDDSSSEDTSDQEWRMEIEERKKVIDEQWKAFETGDQFAEPHSVEWNKANFLGSRDTIELLQRKDGKPLQSDEIQYTVAATPLNSVTNLSKSSRLVLIDLGFACTFDACEQRPLHNLSDFQPPEHLLGKPATHKADIFSLGLLFWEIVILRRLVEPFFSSDDPKRVYTRNRQLRDLAHRLGPVPTGILVLWPAANKFVDANGKALDMHEEDGQEPYEPDEFEYGDIWHEARKRKPLDMSDIEMKAFVDLVMRMLQWEPETRPSTAELLHDPWFKDLEHTL
ncbi:kinase-like protein [Stipitochalara longipes BDJ]|nr:kinase-like protein [Stipitochalara longipes BDJ]